MYTNHLSKTAQKSFANHSFKFVLTFNVFEIAVHHGNTKRNTRNPFFSLKKDCPDIWCT